MVGDQAEEDLAGAELDRRTAGEDRGADHSGRAAEDPEAARQALVEIARPHDERRGDERAGDEMSGGRRERLGVDVERRQADLAAVVGPVERVEPRLAGDERDGVRRAERRTHDRAGVRVDAARDVEREPCAGQGARRAHELGHRPGERPHEADAEEPVDDQVVARFRRDRLQQPSVGGVPLRSRGARVVRELRRVAGEHDVDAMEPALEVRRDLEGVAAVVARTGEHEHRAAGVAGQFERELGGGATGALHQVRPRIALQRGGFERADAVDGVERREARVHGGQEFNRVPPPPGRGQS